MAAMVVGLVALGAVLLPGACGRDRPRPLVVLTGSGDIADSNTSRSPVQMLIDFWNETHPRTPAVLKAAGLTADQQYVEMRRHVDPTNRDDDEFDVDVLNLDVPWIFEFADRGHIVPIDESRLADGLLDGLLAGPRESCRSDGRLWALPFHADAGVLYYHKPLLGRQTTDPVEADLTWADITEQTRRALSEGHDGLEAGYTGQFSDGYEGLTVNFLELLWAFEDEGESDNDLGLTVDPGTWIKAVDFLYRNPDPVILGDYTFNETRSTVAFAERRVIFMRNWPRAYQDLVPGQGPAGTEQLAEIGVTTLPGPSVLGGQNLAVAEKSRNPEAAQELIGFLASRPAQRLLMQLGGFAPTWRDLYDDTQLKQLYPHALTIRTAIDRARLRPKARDYRLFSQTVRELIVEIRTGNAVPANLEQRLRAALDGRDAPR